MGGYNFNVNPVQVDNGIDYQSRKDAAALRKQQLQENQIKLDEDRRAQRDRANRDKAAAGAYRPQSYTPQASSINVGGANLGYQPATVQGPTQEFNRGSYIGALQKTDPFGAMQQQQQFQAQDMEAQKQQVAFQDSLTTADTHKLELAGKQLDLTARMLGGVKSAPPELQAQVYQGVRQQAIQMGLVQPNDPQVPEQFPGAQWLEQKLQSTLSTKEQIDIENKHRDQQITMRGQDATAATAAAGQAVTMRGQNMTDKRSRDANAIAQQNRTQRPPSEGERTAFSFYKRASDAEKVLTDLEPKIAAMGMAGQVGRAVLPNMLQSDDNQVYQQAQRQFTQAKLRRESGAAISQSEYDQDAKTYFPAPGDSKPVLQRKAKARQAIMSELKVASGRAYTETYGDSAGGGKEINYKIVNGQLVPE